MVKPKTEIETRIIKIESGIAELFLLIKESDTEIDKINQKIKEKHGK